MGYQPRTYRRNMMAKGLVSFQVEVRETDIHVSAKKNLQDLAKRLVEEYRGDIEGFIARQPMFERTFRPYEVPESAPEIVREMAAAAKIAEVGPMAAVAGAVAEYVGRGLLEESGEVIVENGGDVFMATSVPRRVAVLAGASPVSGEVAIEIDPADSPLGICTSSGTVGHSVSLGKADAVLVMAKSTALADAAATATGNLVKDADDIELALEDSRRIHSLLGVVIVKDDHIGAWGKVKFVPLTANKGSEPE